MTGVSEMRLLKYKVVKTYFELNEHFQYKKEKINLEPVFKRDVAKQDDQKYEITLGISISSDHYQYAVPFNVEVIIKALFEMNNWEKVEMKTLAIDNATAILFPYLRTLLANVTMNGNVPPYMLPIMNVAMLFNEKQKETFKQ